MNVFWYVNVIAMLAYVFLFYYKWKKSAALSHNLLYLVLIVAIVTYFMAEGPYPISRAVAFFILLILDLTLLLQQKAKK